MKEFLYIHILAIKEVYDPLQQSGTKLESAKNDKQLNENTVVLHYIGPASNRIPPEMKEISESHERIFIFSNKGNNKIPCITNENCWALQIRYGVFKVF